MESQPLCPGERCGVTAVGQAAQFLEQSVPEAEGAIFLVSFWHADLMSVSHSSTRLCRRCLLSLGSRESVGSLIQRRHPVGREQGKGDNAEMQAVSGDDLPLRQ